MRLRDFPNGLLDLATDFTLWGLPVCLIVAAWIASIILRNYHRRGCAATSFALIRVRGSKLAMVRHADVTEAKWGHHGSSGKGFSVLDLKPAAGKPLRLYAASNWVEVAVEQLAQFRATAGLPPVTPDVTWGPYYGQAATAAGAGEKA